MENRSSKVEKKRALVINRLVKLTFFTERGSNVMFTHRDVQKQKARNFDLKTSATTKACTEHSQSVMSQNNF